jgi:hypothetical protein
MRVDPMVNLSALSRLLLLCSVLAATGLLAPAQGQANGDNGSNFGPVMRAYLGYLSNEQEVVDDRNSRREISAVYYRRNLNRIRALRQMAIRLVRDSGNDYVPELEAVAPDELRTLFEKPPNPTTFRPNEILSNKFRFLGVAHTGEMFYLFARLDPYEQAELMQKQSTAVSQTASAQNGNSPDGKGQRAGQTATRPRRTIPR